MLAACSAGGSERTLLVSAAASLTDAFAAVESAFEEGHPGVDVVLNLAGTSTLREQILEGAPVDVFASANTETMDAVVDAGLASEPVVFATNALVVAVPRGNPGDVEGLTDLARDDLVVGLCIVDVPCGGLARLALEDAGVAADADTEEPDVRALLAKLAAAEVDVGIVYATDVVAAGGAVVGVGPGLGPVAEYPIVALVGSTHPAEAEAFVDFVVSDRGRAIMAEYGFGTP